MPWARVQSVSGNTLSSLTEGIAFTTANVTLGNKIIVAVGVDSGSQSCVGVSDGTNAFTNLGTALQTSQVQTTLWALDVAAGIAGTKPTITATAGNSTSSIAVLAMEFSGLLAGNTSAMIDGTAGTNAGATTTIASPTYSSTAANELLIEVIADWGGGATCTYTIPAGFTGDANNINSSSTGAVLAAWNNSTGGSESNHYTLAATDSWGQIQVAFKLAPVASIPNLVMGPMR